MCRKIYMLGKVERREKREKLGGMRISEIIKVEVEVASDEEFMR